MKKEFYLENRWNKIKDENRWGKFDKDSEKPNWICKDCYDGGIIVEYSIDKKIADEFKKYEKTFTEKSEPRYWNELAQKVTLKEIHNNADIGDNPVVLIAVTRQQYNLENFPKYRKYLKDVVKTDTIYYGLWPDTENKKVEYDILYTINSIDKNEIQKTSEFA